MAIGACEHFVGRTVGMRVKGGCRPLWCNGKSVPPEISDCDIPIKIRIACLCSCSQGRYRQPSCEQSHLIAIQAGANEGRLGTTTRLYSLAP
ncbi:hypothetical protein D3C85_1753420 [compost metagenome]